MTKVLLEKNSIELIRVRTDDSDMLINSGWKQSRWGDTAACDRLTGNIQQYIAWLNCHSFELLGNLIIYVYQAVRPKFVIVNILTTNQRNSVRLINFCPASGSFTAAYLRCCVAQINRAPTARRNAQRH